MLVLYPLDTLKQTFADTQLKLNFKVRAESCP